MQFFGARANLAKCLLYAINGGIDEKSKEQIGPKYAPVTSEILNYDEVMDKIEAMMEWLAELYVNTLNILDVLFFREITQFALIETLKEYLLTNCSR